MNTSTRDTMALTEKHNFKVVGEDLNLVENGDYRKWHCRGNIWKVNVPMRRLVKNLDMGLMPNLMDLRKVFLPTMSRHQHMSGGNHSEFMNGIVCTASVKTAGTTTTEKSDVAQFPVMKRKGFSLR